MGLWVIYFYVMGLIKLSYTGWQWKIYIKLIFIWFNNKNIIKDDSNDYLTYTIITVRTNFGLDPKQDWVLAQQAQIKNL